MTQITPDQYTKLTASGLSPDKIASLAASKGYTLPSKSSSGTGNALIDAVQKVGDVTGVGKLGQGLGYSLFQLTPEYKQLTQLLDQKKITPEKFTELTTGNITNKQVLGSAVQTAGNIVGAGEIPGVSELASSGKPAGFLARTLSKAKTGLIKGGISGAILGGANAGGESLQNNDSLPQTALDTAAGVAGGAILGGASDAVLSAGGGTISDLLKARASRKADIIGALTKQAAGKIDNSISALGPGTSSGPASTLENVGDSLDVGAPINTGTVGFKLADNGSLVKDKNAMKLMRDAAIEPDDVAVLKGSSPSDRRVMLQMLDTADKNATDPTATTRPIEHAGMTFLRRVNYLRNEEDRVGKQIDTYARDNFKGVKLPDLDDAVDKFENTLSLHGVTPTTPTVPGSDVSILDGAPKTDLDFKGSDFEDLPGTTRALKTIFRRAQDINGDAYKAHQLKKLIDTQIEYGKRSNAEGLTASAEAAVKSLRHNLDSALDASDAGYKTDNTRYGIATNARKEVEKLVGRNFAEGPQEALRAGEVMNRLLGNASARPLSVLNQVDDAVTKLSGKPLKGNLPLQIRFADMLDDVYGSQPRSLGGLVERAASKAFNMRNVASGAASVFNDKAGEYLKAALTKTPDQRAALLREFLESMK